MNTNDNILASLAALERNLEGIVSAKQQVSEVVQSSKDLADIIDSYKSSFEGLSSTVAQILDKSKDLNLNVLSELSKLTGNLKDEITKLSEFNFDVKFQTLQQEAIREIERSLSARLSIFDTKAQVLQEKSDLIQGQVALFESLDLENQFNRHQKSMNELFNYFSQQDKRLQNKFTDVENQLIDLLQQSADLRKDILTNRLIQIVGIGVLIVSVVILWLK